MLLEDHAADRLDRRFDGGELDQHLGAVAAVLDHALCRLHMADYAAHPVEHRLGVLRRMHVAVVMVMRAVAVDMRMCVLMAVLIYVSVLMEMFVRMNMFVII